MSGKFNIKDLEFDYFHHEYNKTYLNERIVEVPLGMYFIDKFGAENITEIGAVMPYYNYQCKEVIDMRDPHNMCYRKNAAYNVEYTKKNILSISTIEHFKIGEYKNRTNQDSIICLNKIIEKSSNYLITWALGYNKFLDEYVKNSNIKTLILKRISEKNEWIVDHSFDHKYNSPFNYGNAICVVTNLIELL